MSKAKEKIVIALDFDSIDKSIETIDQLSPYVDIFKIGLQLFCSEGLKVIELLTNYNKKIFFDCKLHDIPNTVAKASEALVNHGITFFNVHALGGYQMMNDCVQAANKAAESKGLNPPIVLGVTLLTSINQVTLTNDLDINYDINDYVIRLAKLAQKAGLSGVVASALEAKKIKEHCGEKFIVLAPGIRPVWATSYDQKRIVTPNDAIKAGCDYMVIGRPVTHSNNQVEAMKLIIDEIDESMKEVY